MKKILLFLLSAAALTLGAEVIKDLSYYEDEKLIDNDKSYALERCKLDVYTPDRKAKLPVVVYFHGGGLTGGSKHLHPCLKSDKIVVVAPNYRLSSKRAKCPDYIYDAAAACAWVFKHIAEYGGDPNLVTVSGHSAGGYLSAMIGMDGRYLQRFGYDKRKFLLIAPVSGQMTTHFRIQTERLGKDKVALADLPLRSDEYAPLFHAAGDLSPIVLYTGSSDSDWPARPEENALLCMQINRVHKAANAAKHHAFANYNHGNCRFPALYQLVNVEIPARLKALQKK